LTKIKTLNYEKIILSALMLLGISVSYGFNHKKLPQNATWYPFRETTTVLWRNLIPKRLNNAFSRLLNRFVGWRNSDDVDANKAAGPYQWVWKYRPRL